MKKMYITPQVEISETVTASMMALSLQSGAADSSDVLGNEEKQDWDMWSED